MKVASAIVRRMLIDTGSSVDIITWDCLKKLTYPRRDIIPLVHPILGFGGQEVNLTRMIRLPLRFGDKGKARNVNVDFLVVDVPTTYNIILGRPTLHKEKAIIAPTCFSFNLKPTMEVWACAGRLAHSSGIGVVPSSSSPSPEGDKLHFFGVLALSLGLLAFLYIMDIENEKLEKDKKEEYVPLTSATTTSSSVTSGGYEVPEAAKSHDLSRSRTNSNLAAESSAKKLVERARVLMGVSPHEKRSCMRSLKSTRDSWRPRASPPTNRSTERVGGDDSLTSFPLIEARVEAAVSSWWSSIS
ncbi:hypothetical protein Cgig2_025026 [Carnegiea gigantea]|uniref:Peptidase A2 domain-containing protein n=1 Tax=Carnegiea gigantea TaxID=171969 RepID=A0A9Q1K0N4_9CARY|nr:hypothetical protein Cgig2_025026 [Carnegiea gigantea]